jgi:hypothetical protein
MTDAVGPTTKVLDKGLFFDAIGYKPFAEQKDFHNSKARFRCAVCGRRFGKSTMVARDAEPELLIPKRRFWIVGPTYDLGEKEFRVIWDDLIIKRGLGKDKRIKKAYNVRSGDMYLEFPWQTRIEVRSADHPEGLVGEALDGVIMSEAAKHKRETWERYIRPALADRRGWGTFGTTPEGFNWIYELYLFGQNPDLEDYASWKFPSWFNTVVFPGGRHDPEIELLAKTTTPEWFMQEIGADFASFVGRIYPEFEVNTHVRHVGFNPMWKNFISFDFGYIEPLAAIEWQIDSWDNVYIWREHYKAGLRLEEHIKELKARIQPPDYHLDLTFGDAADPEAAAYISNHFCMCVADPKSKANWREGIDCVKTFLKPYQTGEMDEWGTPKMTPKLFIDPSCTWTIKEFSDYRTKNTARQANAPKESNQVGAAMHQNDHAMDAIRYGLMHWFKLGYRHHLSETLSPAELVTTARITDEGYFTSGMTF